MDKQKAYRDPELQSKKDEVEIQGLSELLKRIQRKAISIKSITSLNIVKRVLFLDLFLDLKSIKNN